MNKQLLEDVIYAIEQAPPEMKFDMGRWKSTNCTTAGCAIGCYCTVFPDVDLKLIPDYETDSYVNYIPRLNITENFDEPTQYIYDFLAVAQYFDLGFGNASYLFDPDYYEEEFDEEGRRYISKETVINRIRNFIKGHEVK